MEKGWLVDFLIDAYRAISACYGLLEEQTLIAIAARPLFVASGAMSRFPKHPLARQGRARESFQQAVLSIDRIDRLKIVAYDCCLL